MANLIKLRNIKRALKLSADHVKNDDRYAISGRVSNLRQFRSFNFVDLVDGSTKSHLQVVLSKSLLKKPELGSYLTCEGRIVASPGSMQQIEFKADKLNFASQCDPDEYLLAQVKSQLPDNQYRKHIHWRPQVSRFASLLRVRSELELSLHMILKQMDFFRVHPPTLTCNDSEASSDLFRVNRSQLQHKSDRGQSESNQRASDDKYFDKEVFLVTSAQLHLECLAAALSRVYTISPCFRAERSISQRHLCEFQMLEAEEANVTRLDDLMGRVESVIKFAAQFLSNVSEHNQDFAHLLEHNSNSENFHKLTDKSYVRMTYKEALRILQSKSDPTLPTDYGCDISRKHEKQLLEHCDNVPIFITSYPKRLKPFYMKRNGDDEEEVECFDLIAPIGGEICGGSLREDDLERLQSNLRIEFPQAALHSGRNQAIDGGDASGNNSDLSNSSGHMSSGQQRQERRQISDFDWYADLRRFGTFPHGGFGIGFERLIQSLLGITNIKDTIAFPRWYGHCPM